MKFEDFIKLVDQTYNRFNWRYGQTLMNVLYSVDKEKYAELADTENDCYYYDDRVKSTIEILTKIWKT